MKNKKYPITQCLLYKCGSKARLEKALTIKTGELKLLEYAISYHKFEIEKKDSIEKRKISAPDYTLKLIQARTLRLIQSIERPEWLISGQKGISYIDNGKKHLNSSFALAMDIKKFYDNCKRDPVYQFFRNNMKTAPDVAALLTDIVTYNGGIPTGCPTSQLIAYYAYEGMFSEIKSIADQAGCIFTLYVDDMMFSSDQPFNKNSLERAVDIELRKHGHKPKYSKVRYYSREDHKPITGTIVTPNHRLEIPNKLQQKIYDGFQEVKMFDAETLDSEKYCVVSTLFGRISAAKSIQPSRFPQISSIVDGIKVAPIKTVKNKREEKPRRIRIRQSDKHISNSLT